MKYRFRAVDFWEELKTAVGNIPCSVTDSGDEMLLDFEGELTLKQESALKALMETRPMLRNHLAKFVDKGVNIELTEEATLNANAR